MNFYSRTNMIFLKSNREQVRYINSRSNLVLSFTYCFLIYNTLLILIAQASSSGNVLPVDPHFSISQKCQHFESILCNIDSYSTVQPFRNTLGHTKIEEAVRDLHKFYFLFQDQRCRSKIQLFVCSLFAPVCVNSTMYPLDNLLLPCRDDCEEAQVICAPSFSLAKETWPKEWNCTKFNYSKDDPLCVINNAKSSTPGLEANPPHTSYTGPPLDTRPQPVEEVVKPLSVETYCDGDLFDCRLLDPSRNMKALCIDPNWVCNGKKDCVINGTSSMTEGLDESDCDKKCIDGLYCDDRCISTAEICDGKMDCSLGLDEQNCNGPTSGPSIDLTQVILSLSIVILVVCLVMKQLKSKNKSPQSEVQSENQIEKPSCYSIGGQERRLHTEPVCPIENSIDQPIDISGRFDHSHSIQRLAMYPEPAYSISTRSDYERLNVGGYSGASSVYAYATFHHPHSLDILKAPPDELKEPPDELKEPPAAPPPTPTPQQIWSSGSITKDCSYLD